MSTHSSKINQRKVIDNPANVLEGHVQTVTAGHRNFCLTQHEGQVLVEVITDVSLI